MNIAIIGGGEVGRCYAQVLAQAGHRLAGICDTRPTPALRQCCETLGADLHEAPGQWLAQADAVISAVFGTVALATFEQALPFLRPGTLYADFTTASPQDMAAAAESAARHDVPFADVAITGAISLGQGATPLLCAGSGAPAAHALMAAAGAPIQTVGSRAGDAATLKLLRSIYTKGCEALAVECLVAAQAKGLRQDLYRVLQDIDQQPLQVLLDMLVRTHVLHAERRLAEVREATRQLERDGLEPRVMGGVQALFERTVQALDGTQDGSSVEASLRWLEPLARRAAR
ncbi:NAD(P)-binding domain-containing protein [Orrella sp. JC864]|uniref:NAD(P)-dependent oxidoreductase n=1 Tax=Orrella sp. JC864 TaxID=3120298 RepID=UPI0012BD25B4